MTDDVMHATCRALQTQGYADLTMQDIADESSRSKAALHYHYDSKRELLVAFLDHLSERYVDRIRDAADPDDDPDARLSALLDAALSPPDTDDLAGFQTALLELKAQSPYDEAFRERSRETDAAIRSLIADVLADGVESGAFRENLDPDATARFVATVLSGAYLRRVSIGQDPERARELLQTHLEEHVRADQGASG